MKKRLSILLCFLAFTLISFHRVGPFLANAESFTYSNFKVCRGSSSGLSHTNAGQPWNRYLSYVSIYANCTTVLDSLEIVFLEGDYNYDMSFLESIREVNGYVWIVGNNFDFLPLKNLRVIRGWNLYKPQGSTVSYSLYISTNRKTNSTSVGLKELQLNSLREILDGNVLIEDNNLLCHEQTINWTDIRGDASKVQLKPPPQGQYRRPCEECHPSCTFNGVAHCWGPGPDKCQKSRALSTGLLPWCDDVIWVSSQTTCDSFVVARVFKVAAPSALQRRGALSPICTNCNYAESSLFRRCGSSGQERAPTGATPAPWNSY